LPATVVTSEKVVSHRLSVISYQFLVFSFS
jgi:hypothetical protein